MLRKATYILIPDHSLLPVKTYIHEITRGKCQLSYTD